MSNLRTIHYLGLAAVLAPVAYIIGRYATTLALPEPLAVISQAAVMIAMGVLVGMPIGLFFGRLRPTPITASRRKPNVIVQQDKILEQLKDELIQNKNLFEARKGNQTFLTRIAYLTGFWTAAKSSGQLFVMQEPKLLNTIATAYYWLEQANRLENLAYESQYAPHAVVDNQNATTHLIAEVRLLDGPLSIALQGAIDAVSNQLATDRQAIMAQQAPAQRR